MIRFTFQYNGLPVEIVSADIEFRSWILADRMFFDMGIYDEPLLVTIKPADQSCAFPTGEDGLFIDKIHVDFFALSFEAEARSESGNAKLFRLAQYRQSVQLFEQMKMSAHIIEKARAEYRYELAGAYLLRFSGGGYRTNQYVFEHDAQSWRDANKGG